LELPNAVKREDGAEFDGNSALIHPPAADICQLGSICSSGDGQAKTVPIRRKQNCVGPAATRKDQ
jgi:hypothetical protein